MPLTDMGGGCFKWGQKGKKYCGKGAKHKALMQGYAEDPKHFKQEMSKNELVTAEELEEFYEELVKAGEIDRYDYYTESYISKKERDEIPASDYAWPEAKKYPIRTQEEVDAAARLIGRAPKSKQASIKRRIISIAKRKGFKLPESYSE